MEPFDFRPQTRVVFGGGALTKLGALAQELGFRRTLIVSDPGVVRSGHFESASKGLRNVGIEVFGFHDFGEDPDTHMVESGRDVAAKKEIDSLVGLGGGSSMDCAKGINFLLTNGGTMKDYWGIGKASKLMLPSIGIPTTAGTGSEAQSFALISDAESHAKMACGDPKAAFRIALLDPELTVSQPKQVTAATGFDAIAHAVETYVTLKRNQLSDTFSREAWRLLEANYERALFHPDDIEARASMQLGAYYAGVAIENSMLGAAHAGANPLTAHYGTTHGVALAILLPRVVRWNAEVAGTRYAELVGSSEGDAGEELAKRLQELVAAGDLSARLSTVGVPKDDLEMLAEEAARQWTGSFNPRAFDASGALEVYRWAY